MLSSCHLLLVVTIVDCMWSDAQVIQSRYWPEVTRHAPGVGLPAMHQGKWCKLKSPRPVSGSMPNSHDMHLSVGSVHCSGVPDTLDCRPTLTVALQPTAMFLPTSCAIMLVSQHIVYDIKWLRAHVQQKVTPCKPAEGGLYDEGLIAGAIVVLTSL